MTRSRDQFDEPREIADSLASSLGLSRSQELLDHLSQSVFLKDRELHFVAVNKAFCAGLGKTAEEILGRDDYAFYPPDLAEKYRADDRRILATGVRLETEEQNLRDGETCTVRVVKTPVFGAGGQVEGVLGIFWDVTDQRHLEAQLRQVQKMEAIGQLASGIAHDFNNLLTCVLGNLALAQSEIARLQPAPASPLLDHLDGIDKAGQRAAELTRQLLAFSRRLQPNPQPLDLNVCAQEAVRFFRRSLDPQIVVQMRLEPQLWKVQADPGQMHQVLLNLSYNATDAMPQGGALALETANVCLVSPTASLAADKEKNRPALVLPCTHPESQPGDYVRLRISDTGQGISASVLPHIFEPFFSTKAFGKGSGLALAVVYGIVKEHQGWIECRSQAGLGTQFDCFLPRCLQDAPKPPAADLLSGRETILLADDHQVVRAMGREILESYGYRVLTASDDKETLDLFRAHQHAIDLVLLDLALPRVTDHETLEELRHIEPQVRVLICASFPVGPALRAVERIGAAGCIAKPYQAVDLARGVRAALDRPRTATSPFGVR